MRAFRNLFSMFAAAVISLVAVSCSLFGDEEPSAERNFVEPALTASVSGSVSVSGAVPGALRSSAARTALPSLGEELSYSVEASSGGRKYKADVDAENLSFSFGDIAVVEGGTEYTITATGKIGDETVLFGEVKKTLKPGDAFFCEVPVKPYMKSGKGTVNLEISVSETKIRSCAVTISGEDCVIPPPVYSGGKITWSAELDSGCYDAVFSFYSTADSSSADGVLLYEVRESVHVCKSLVTDSWFGSSAYITTDGKCVITKALVDKFALSRIYVSSRKEDSKETGTRAEPYKSVARAMNALLDKDTDYTILVDGELTGAQTIPDTLTTEAGGTYKAKSLVIKGAGAGAKINGNNEGTALTIRTAVPVTIENLTITGGKATNGGGIYMGSGTDVTLSNSAVEKNESSGYGGGIAVYCATLSIDKSTISKNKTTTQNGGVGGGVALEGSDTVTAKVSMNEGSVISGNTAYSNKNGGGVALYIGKSTFTMTGGEISGNRAYCGGGVDLCNDAEFIMEGGKISGNNATHSSGTVYGGGVYIRGKGSFSISGGEISGNKAKDSGGAVAFERECFGTAFTMTGGKISGNEAPCAGGIYARNGTVSITGGEISGNKATGTSGGGIYCGGPFKSDPAENGTVTVGGTAVIKGNSANKFGGGVFVEYGKSFAFEGGTIGGSSGEDANAAEQGGGIYVSGSLAMTGGLIKGNTVTEDGGGLYVSGTSGLSGGSIESNSATGRGGGIFMNNGSLTLENSISIPAGSGKKNDLYLISGKTVALSDSLASGTVATITPQEYADGTPILSLAEASSTTIEAERAKFSIKQQSEQLEIFDISNEGYLTNVVFSFDRAFPNGTVYGTEVHEDKTYIVIKYRYTQYDSLSMSITNPFADMGWSMEFNLDDVSTDPASVTTLSDGYHTLSATLSKGSESVTAVTRVRAMIKPVTVTVQKVKGFITRGDGYRISLNVYLYIQGKNGDEYTQEQTIAHWSGVYDTDFNSEPATNNDPVILTAKDSTFYFYTSQAADEWNTSGPLGLINRGYEYTTRTLADLKKSKSFDSQCVNSSGNKCSDSGKRAHYWFTATLDDSD